MTRSLWQSRLQSLNNRRCRRYLSLTRQGPYFSSHKKNAAPPSKSNESSLVVMLVSHPLFLKKGGLRIGSVPLLCPWKGWGREAVGRCPQGFRGYYLGGASARVASFIDDRALGNLLASLFFIGCGYSHVLVPVLFTGGLLPDEVSGIPKRRWKF